MPASPSQFIPLESLYVHVPFCARKCAYCAFYSEPSSLEWMDRYVAALIQEMKLVATDLRPRTIFFGGGTPSLLNLRQWESILRAMELLNLRHPTEWTVECNPATLSLDKARRLREGGVNRISMGVQSLDPKLLERLGRVHTRAMAFKSFDLLRKAGFDNINLDLMFAIPGQTMEMWKQTLAEALVMGSEHLSCYEVIYEDDTPFFAQFHSGESRPDEDLACAMYEELLERAEGAGLHQYEIANFARDRRRGAGVTDCWSDEASFGQHSNAPTLQYHVPAFACRHNVNYWRGGPFHGLGPSATGYVGGVRTKNCSNTQRYCEQLEKGTRALEFCEELPPLARAGETAAFGLRMVVGWSFEEFRQTTGHDLRQDWSSEMNQLVERGWGRIAPDRFQLTRLGLRFADAAAELFLR